MRGRSSGTDGALKTAFGQRVTGGLERAFDLRDPYKLNRAPLLRGGKRGLTSIGSIICVILGIALLIGLGVLIGRELVRPPRRSWEGKQQLRPAPVSSHLLGPQHSVIPKPLRSVQYVLLPLMQALCKCPCIGLFGSSIACPG